MKKKYFCLLAMLSAGVFPAAATENFYLNPKYKHSPIIRKGKYHFDNHWTSGKVTPASAKKKKSAVRLEVAPAGSVKADGIFCTTNGGDLEPGSYYFSIDCCPETDLDSVYLYVGCESAPGKRVSKTKVFPAEQLVKGKWTRLIFTFEGKEGFEKYAFGYGIRSRGAAAALFAGPKVEAVGLYKNPFYQGKKLSSGKFSLDNHWYKGKLSVEGDYQGMPVVKIESDKADWGVGAFAATISTDVIPKLDPGKYLLAVRCRPVKDAKYNSFTLFFTRKLNGAGKRTMINKKFEGSNLPEAEKWTELVMPVEVKPGDSNFSFAYGFWGKTENTAFFTDPRILRDENGED